MLFNSGHCHLLAAGYMSIIFVHIVIKCLKGKCICFSYAIFDYTLIIIVMKHIVLHSNPPLFQLRQRSTSVANGGLLSIF